MKTKSVKWGIMAMALLSMAMPFTAKAQDKVEASAGVDLVSGYVWRGQDLGGVSLQPSASIAYKGFSLGAWGSVGIESSDTKEFDLILGYSTGGFSVSVTDYWYNVTGDGVTAKYFQYGAHNAANSHLFEAQIGYDFGPVAINWYTNFAGADGLNKDGDRAYSSYVEASAPFKLGGCDWTATIGAVPFATSFYYGHENGVGGFAVTNVSVKATKDIKITDSFSVPVFAQVAANPSNEKAYLVVGFTLQP